MVACRSKSMNGDMERRGKNVLSTPTFLPRLRDQTSTFLDRDFAIVPGARGRGADCDGAAGEFGGDGSGVDAGFVGGVGGVVAACFGLVGVEVSFGLVGDGEGVLVFVLL